MYNEQSAWKKLVISYTFIQHYFIDKKFQKYKYWLFYYIFIKIMLRYAVFVTFIFKSGFVYHYNYVRIGSCCFIYFLVLYSSFQVLTNMSLWCIYLLIEYQKFKYMYQLIFYLFLFFCNGWECLSVCPTVCVSISQLCQNPHRDVDIFTHQKLQEGLRE